MKYITILFFFFCHSFNIQAQCDITAINYTMPQCNIAGETITITWNDNCPATAVNISLVHVDLNVAWQSEVNILNTQSFDFTISNATPTANYQFYIQYVTGEDWLYGPTTYQNNQPEISVLENFFYDFQGSSWSNNSGWLTDCDPCGVVSGTPWFGIQCNGVGNVTQISLPNNGLVGSLPENILTTARDNICDINVLETLDLSNNNIAGEIPECIFTATLDVSLNDNLLSGELPASFANLTSSAIIHLQNNNLSGCYANIFNPECTIGYTNAQISDGNDFDADWEDYCANGNGVCCYNNYDLDLTTIENGTYYAGRQINISGIAPASANLTLKAPLVSTENITNPGATNNGLIEISPDGCNDKNALYFDGVNDYIWNSNYDVGGDFSISFWFKTDGQTSAAENRMFSVASTTSQFLEIGIHHDPPYNLWLHDTENSINQRYGTSLLDGIWHHVVFTASSTQRKLYLDGALLKTYSASHFTYDSYYRIGRWIGGGNQSVYQGEIDEFRIYNIPLEQSDVSEENDCGIYTNESSLGVHYSFDEGLAYADNSSVDTIFNQVGNIGHATMVNFTLTDTVSNFVGPLEITPDPCCSAGFTLLCQSVGAALIPVDTNNDSVPDDEQVTLDAALFDAGTTLNCGDTYLVAYDALGTITMQTFDCDDIGTQFIDIFFISNTGIVEQCMNTAVMIVDNNSVDICP